MEDGVRRGESRADSHVSPAVLRQRQKRARKHTLKAGRRAHRGFPKSRRERVEIGPRRWRARRVVDSMLTSEPIMHAVRESHPNVYAMLVELCRGQSTARVINLRGA